MPIVTYKCEHCKRIFDNLKATTACEKSHVKIKTAKIVEYGMASIYPVFVDIEFSNGGTERYMLEKVAYFSTNNKR